jgi:predicted nucleotide-binding protein (sugar kinase/HSP70/actin superfamily)
LPILKKGQKTTDHKTHTHPASSTAAVINVDPRTVQRALSQAVKTFSDPEYQAQITKLTQASISNSLQTIQKMGVLSGRLSKLNDADMNTVVEESINDLTRAVLQFNSDQLVLVQKLSARTLEILENQTREK